MRSESSAVGCEDRARLRADGGDVHREPREVRNAALTAQVRAKHMQMMRLV